MQPPTAPRGSVPAAIVLVNWNSWRHCLECIDSLLAQDYPDFHVFLVDNDSRDGSVEQIAAWCAAPKADPQWRRHDGVDRYTDRYPHTAIDCRVADRPQAALPASRPGTRLTLIRAGGNLGFAGGCNVGIRAAGLEAFTCFWLLNTDTVVHRHALRELVDRATRDSQTGLVGSTIRFYDRPETLQCLGGARLHTRSMSSHLIGEGQPVSAVPQNTASVEAQMAYVMGASMLVTAAFIKKVGLLQEDYFLYYEEIDWALRGREHFRVGYAAGSHVFHRSGASSSRVMPAFSSNLYYRNRLRFVSRFFPDRLGAAKRGMAVDLLRHSLRGRWTHARIVAAALWDAPALTSQERPWSPQTPS
ncbi:MAG TPA: glycosyltransferase family 2 protein [Steroidobacteraceae bacterium]|jgi:hypothetical protein